MAYETLIDVKTLRGVSGSAQLVLFDCRFDLSNPNLGRAAFATGHIPGAAYVDLNRDLAAPVTSTSGRHPLPTPEGFAARLGAWGVGNDSQVIAYDEANGSFAARLWWMLRWLGHRTVAVLDGGLNAWIAAGGALETGFSTPRALVRFEGRADRTALVGAAGVLDAVTDPASMLVDARAVERFSGAAEPIDPIAGHVSGAVNHPFSQNLEPDGRFLPPAVLRQRWRSRLGDTAPGNVIAMCGSGVTACHNLLSLEIAGFSGARLYPGSWSEWIRDPRRPIARGA